MRGPWERGVDAELILKSGLNSWLLALLGPLICAVRQHLLGIGDCQTAVRLPLGVCRSGSERASGEISKALWACHIGNCGLVIRAVM